MSAATRLLESLCLACILAQLCASCLQANGKVGKQAKKSGPVQSSLAAFIGLKPKEASASSSQPASQQSDPHLERAIEASLAAQSDAAQGTGNDAPAQQNCWQHGERQTMQSQASGGGQSQAGSGDCSEPPDLERLVEEDQREAELRREFEEQECQAALDSNQRQRDAAAAWRVIHERMKPPKCFVHHEDCVIRTVKKKGPNFGKALSRSPAPADPPQQRSSVVDG